MFGPHWQLHCVCQRDNYVSSMHWISLFVEEKEHNLAIIIGVTFPIQRDFFLCIYSFHVQVEVVRGCGRYIPRQPYSDIVYSRIQQRDKVRRNQ